MGGGGGVRPADLVFVPTVACRGFRDFSVTTGPLPASVVSDDGAEAGLTSKPHRDPTRGAPPPADAPQGLHGLAPSAWLRGPFRLRLASACHPDTGVRVTQPRTRTDSMHRR